MTAEMTLKRCSSVYLLACFLGVETQSLGFRVNLKN